MAAEPSLLTLADTADGSEVPIYDMSVGDRSYDMSVDTQGVVPVPQEFLAVGDTSTSPSPVAIPIRRWGLSAQTTPNKMWKQQDTTDCVLRWDVETAEP